MTNQATLVCILLGAGCPALLAGPSTGGGDLSTEGARVNLSQPEAEAADAVPQDSGGWLSGWSGSVELGLTGASGNNENFSFRTAANAGREDDRSADKIGIAYTYSSDDGNQTQNRFTADARHDWKFTDSKWRVYFGGNYEFDEFQDWDHRVSLGPGVGYQAIESEKTSLLLRAAALGTREFGGSDDRWHPEADLGFDLLHQLTERQSLEVNFDLYPSLDPFGPYRFEGDAAWRIELDPEASLFLRIGVEDRYDSSPGLGKKRNDVNYYATIGWAF